MNAARWKPKLSLAGALLAAALGILLYAHRRVDFDKYAVLGNAVLAGTDTYAGGTVSTWPPFFSLVCVPMALLFNVSPYLARATWIVFNYGALVLILIVIRNLANAETPPARAARWRDSLRSPELLIPLLLTSPYIVNNFEELQINLVVFALALGGLYLQEKGRVGWGGAALGMAAAMKLMPGAFIPYLAYRKRWREALSALGATALFSLSPIVVFGWKLFWQNVAAWLSIMRGGWGSGGVSQSVYAMWDRILGFRLIPFFDEGAWDLPKSGNPTAKFAWALTLALVLLWSGLACRGEPRRFSRRIHLEWSIVFIVTVIFGPVTWANYLVVLLLPNAQLYAEWRARTADLRTRRILGLALSIAFVLGFPTLLPELIGHSLNVRLHTASVVTLAALLILGAVLWCRSRAPQAEFG